MDFGIKQPVGHYYANKTFEDGNTCYDIIITFNKKPSFLRRFTIFLFLGLRWEDRNEVR